MLEWTVKINLKVTGSQCNCVSGGNECENRGAPRTILYRSHKEVSDLLDSFSYKFFTPNVSQ